MLSIEKKYFSIKIQIFRHKKLNQEIYFKDIDFKMLNDLTKKTIKNSNEYDYSLEDISVSTSKIIKIENSGYDMQPSFDSSTNESYLSNQSRILKK